MDPRCNLTMFAKFPLAINPLPKVCLNPEESLLKASCWHAAYCCSGELKGLWAV